MALIDFTLSNARRFYSSMENPLGVKGLTTSSPKTYVPINPLIPNSAKWHLEILLCLTPGDFTLSNARRFYSSMENPLGVKGLTTSSPKTYVPINPLIPNSAKWHLEILLCLTPGDFTLSNARRFYSSMENPLGVKGLTTSSPKTYVPINHIFAQNLCPH